MKRNFFLSPFAEAYQEERFIGSRVLLVDIFRATTTMVHLFLLGVEEIVSLESSLMERHALLLSERFELPQEVERLLTALVSFDKGHVEKIKARAVRFGLSFQSE